jgi:tRNA pseudouridine55 synthase
VTGFLLVDKPIGPTSHDVVARARRALDTRRVGHAGTLDPLATGLLILAVGTATRLLEYVTGLPKTYVGTFHLGLTTATEDTTGETLSEADASAVTREQVEALLPRFTGAIQQVPPMVSAVHHEGRRLYELARQGVTVERTPRTVTVHALRLLQFTPGARAELTLEVQCSAGTYVRTLGADIGRELGVGAAMSALRRTAIGPHTVEAAVSLDALPQRGAAALIRPAAMLAHLPAVSLNDGEVGEIALGRAIPTAESVEGRVVRLLDLAGSLVAVAEANAGRLHPRKVLVTPAPVEADA